MSSDSEKTSNELSETRTKWSEDRTILSNERTFAGWMRTGIASVGMGLAIHAIYGKADETVLAKVTSTLFIAIGILIFLQAFLSARKMLGRLDATSAEPVTPTRMAITAGLFSTASGLIAVLLWTI